MKKTILLALALALTPVVSAQDTLFHCTFDQPGDSSGWVLVNGYQTNRWSIGVPNSGVGSSMLFVTDDGLGNGYDVNNASVTYAYRRVMLPRGVVEVGYDWRCMGWEDYYGSLSDYLRVLLVPDEMPLQAGAVPVGLDFVSASASGGAICALDGGEGLNGSNGWREYRGEVCVEEGGTYKLVVMWINWGRGVGVQPPAAVDNLLVCVPRCPRAVGLHIGWLGPNGVTLQWSDLSDGMTTYWEAELCRGAEVPGMGVRQRVEDTMVTFTGLTADGDYRVYVAPMCDGSMRDTVMMGVHTPCAWLTALPYRLDFDSMSIGSFPSCWRLIRSDGYAVVGGEESERWLHWVPSYYGTSCLVLPGVDAGALPVGDLEVSFSCRGGQGNTNELEVGLLPVAEDVESFVPLGRVRLNSDEWVRCVVEFDGYGGGHIGIRARNEGFGPGFAEIDDVVIGRVRDCPELGRVRVSDVNAEGARLEWELVEGTLHRPEGYEVWVEPADSTSTTATAPGAGVQYFYSTGRGCIVSGLLPMTGYRAWVRAMCAAGTYGEWSSGWFTTVPLPCRVGDSTTADTASVGTDAYHSLGVPVSNIFVNSFCQSIYTAEELHAAGVEAGLLTGMDYTFTNNVHRMVMNFFVSTTTDSVFASGGGHLAVGEWDRVYGPANYEAGNSGVVHFEFDNPILWDGVSNLVVTSLINNGSNMLQSASFYGNSTRQYAYRTVYGYLNDEPFTLENIGLGSLAVSRYRPSLVFHTMACGEVERCVPPTIVVSELGDSYAVLDWMPQGEAQAWDVCYRLADDTVWTLADSNWGTNHYVISSLSPNTDYRVRVVPRCENPMGCRDVEFTTGCEQVTLFPWTEGFEYFDAPMQPGVSVGPCWFRYMYGSDPDAPYVRSDNAYGGTHSLFLVHSSGIATPQMGDDVNQLQVSFYAYATGNYMIRVGVMTDPTDYGTFQEVARVSPYWTNTWELKEIGLDGYTGNGRYIALLTPGLTGNSVYIDDVTVEYIPTCPRPLNITVGSITDSTAEVQWYGRGGGSYEVEYGPAGFAPGTGTVASCTTSIITLRGLYNSTPYDVYVRAVCDADTSIPSSVATFTTACGALQALPYTQNFTGVGVGSGARPLCWICGSNYGNSYPYPYIVDYATQPGGRPSCALFLRAYYFTQAYAILPPVDTSTAYINTLQLVVKASGDNGEDESTANMIVGVCSSADFSSFVPIDTLTFSSEMEVYEVPLRAAATHMPYIALLSKASTQIYRNYVYIDSVAVEPIPDCERPRELTVTSITTTTATLHWEGGSATSWQVEYMPSGSPLGTGIRFATTTDTPTITGLTPASQYDYYVRAVCAEGDTSEWSYIPGRINTQQIPATIPYYNSFDSIAEWGSWQTLSNTSHLWCRGLADGQPAPAMYVSTDSGQTRRVAPDRTIYTVTYRDIDFGNLDTSYVLSFSASMGGANYSSSYYNGLPLFLIRPVVLPSEPYDNSGFSPNEYRGDWTLLSDNQGSSGWRDYSYILDSIRGVWRLVFYWYNRTGQSLSESILAPAIDNVSIQYVECQHPYGVHADSVTASAATVAWHGVASGQYHVMLYNTDLELLRDDTVPTNSIQYNNLVPSSIYKLRVCRLCDSTSSRMAPLFTFSTNACYGSTVDTVGNPRSTSSSYNLPLSTCYDYSYTQQIVLASELGGPGEISSISFLYSSPLRMTHKTNCTIYLGHTHYTHFSHRHDLVPQEDLHMVYIGSINCTQGWNTILLGTPFVYDGTSNLVIAIDDNSNAHHNYAFSFATSPTMLPMAIYGYDNNDINPQLFNPANHYFETDDSRTVMAFGICPANSCPIPHLRSPRVRANDITLRWMNTADRYLYGYRLVGSDRWIENNIVTTDTFFTLTRFFFDSDYVYHVRQYCNDDEVSNWAIGSFNTADIPCLPPLDLRVTELTERRVRLAWTPEDNNISYRVHLWGGGIDTILTTYLANYVVEGLNAATRYYAAVEVRCEYLDLPSIWSDTISFVTFFCPDVTDLEALEVHGNSALIEWQCDEGPVEWLIEWGQRGFDQGSGVLVHATTHPFLLTGLTGETSYEVYVRSVCDNELVSENWSTPLIFTTAYSAIAPVITGEVRLIPNPTHGEAELLLPDMAEGVKVEVVDRLGRVCLSHMVQPHTGNSTLGTRALAPGAYYVRITNRSLNATLKFLKL